MTDMVCDFLIGIAVVILSYLFFGRSGEFSRFFCYGFAFSVIFILAKKEMLRHFFGLHFLFVSYIFASFAHETQADGRADADCGCC